MIFEAASFRGVEDTDFRHRSSLHGQGHVNRVMIHAIWAALFYKQDGGTDDLMVDSVCAAFLHDLSRRHDGYCEAHGQWAVDERWAEFEPMFVEWGMKNPEMVKEAVIWHSKPDNEEVLKRNPVLLVLKDADGLDRVRLGDLDVRYLRLNRSGFLVQLAQDLHDLTATEPGKTDAYPRVFGIGIALYSAIVEMGPTGYSKMRSLLCEQLSTFPKQNSSPCRSCPFSRRGPSGKLGGSPMKEYIGQLYAGMWLPCHMDCDFNDPNWKTKFESTAQCAGAAMMRANLGIAHTGINLELPANPKRSFKDLAEWISHHKPEWDPETVQAYLEKYSPEKMVPDVLSRANMKLIPR